MDEPVENTVEDFIARWQHTDGSERANYQLFLTELCALLGLDRPDPASVDNEENAYVFERKVTLRHADRRGNRSRCHRAEETRLAQIAPRTGPGAAQRAGRRTRPAHHRTTRPRLHPRTDEKGAGTAGDPSRPGPGSP